MPQRMASERVRTEKQHVHCHHDRSDADAETIFELCRDDRIVRRAGDGDVRPVLVLSSGWWPDARTGESNERAGSLAAVMTMALDADERRLDYSPSEVPSI